VAAVVTLLAAAEGLGPPVAVLDAGVSVPGEPTPPAEPDLPAGSPVPPPVRPPGAGQRAPGADYAWPLHPAPAVATPFRRPSFRFGRGHRGADLLGAPGQAVLAAREGTVVFAGRVAGRPVVSVDHPDGLRTTYEPVVATVRVGDRLTAGDPIGVLVAGHSDCTGAACLHWGVRRGKIDYLDPLVLVRPPRVRLLPWEGA
jgi:murein DD-endopeptidase MepM/ murein hydrolase activator NlpD